MKIKKIGYFFSLKYIDKNIDVHRHVLETVRNLGFEMYKSELIDKYPSSIKKIKGWDTSLIEATQKQLRSVDFVIAFFSDKSRLVFTQTIVAFENKTPVLCLIHEDNYKDFPEALLSYGKDFVQVRRYRNKSELGEIIREYIEDLEPPKRRFNVVLKTKTLRQMEQLSKSQDITKAGLIRKLVDKECRRVFS